jgi:sulfur relay (sulfurtransferase) DsrF/TusC family protein
MEYIFGSIITLISFFVFNKMTKKIITQKMHVPTFTQSRKVELIKDYLFNTSGPKQEEKTQSREHIKKNSRKAFFWLENVYWIENVFLVKAKLNNNKIDETTKKKVDTHSLNKVELDKITFIVDKLTEGNKDDSGNSGK